MEREIKQRLGTQVTCSFLLAGRWKPWCRGDPVGAVKHDVSSGSKIEQCWSLPVDDLRGVVTPNRNRWFHRRSTTQQIRNGQRKFSSAITPC